MFHEPEHTVEYHMGFELDAGSGLWCWASDVYYDEESALLAFDEQTRHSKMNWCLRKDEIVTTIVQEFNHS